MKNISIIAIMLLGMLTLLCLPCPAHAYPPVKETSFVSMPQMQMQAESCQTLDIQNVILFGDPQRLYAFENRTAIALTSGVAITLIPQHTLTVYTLVADTNVTFSADTSHAIPGDMFVLKVKGNTRTRTMTFSTNLYSPTDSITAGKTVMYEFIWIPGYGYRLIAKAATD